MIDTPLHEPETWRPFLAALRGEAPAGTRETEFRGTVYPRSFGGSTADDGEPRRLGLRSGSGDSAMDALRPLRVLVDGRGVAVRARVTSTGDAQVSIIVGVPEISFGMGSEVIENVLLVPGAVPEPYQRVPVRHDAVTVSPGADPGAVTTLVRRLLPDAQPATSAALAAAEAALGTTLPADVRALYLAADAGELILEPAQDSLFYGLRIVPLDDTGTREYLQPQSRYGSWQYGATEVVAPDPHERVQPLATSPAWFAVGDDWGGNLLVVDLAPGPRGHVGQVLYVDHETNSAARWLAPSLTELLTQRPTELASRGTEDGLLIRIGGRSGETITDVVPETEVLYVNAKSEPVDLAPLAGHARVRTLDTEAAAVTNLDVVTSLPALEFLRLDLVGWRQLLDSGQLPSTLLAAGIRGRADWDASIEVVNALLTRWQRPPVELTEVRLTVA